MPQTDFLMGLAEEYPEPFADPEMFSPEPVVFRDVIPSLPDVEECELTAFERCNLALCAIDGDRLLMEAAASTLESLAYIAGLHRHTVGAVVGEAVQDAIAKEIQTLEY